ncbi:glycosyltransferase family 4 protein [Metabacillus malikii]|nr:glycosyltransferase family 4 protein [Metabacillus malikii]
MRILHLNVAGIVDKFYDTFFEHLRKSGNIDQIEYIAYKPGENKKEELDRFQNYHENIKVILSPIKRSIYRVMYFLKIRKYFLDIEGKINSIKSIDVLHAHSLFSDGGVAYYLKKKYNIPYVVAVRITDVDVFLKYFFHLRPFMKKILLNASKIIFLSPNIKKSIIDNLGNDAIKNNIIGKSEIIPNAVDNFWLKNHYYKEDNLQPELNLIQVGKLNKGKNPKTTILAVSELVNRGYDVKVDFVGEGQELNNLKKLVHELNLEDNVKFHGFIKDKSVLMNLYRKANFFILPSYFETFGISYIEAMSQGLPVIYSRNQGIDGYFEEGEVGVSINPSSQSEICDAVLHLQKSYNDISKRCTSNALSFDWEDLSIKYIEIYSKIIKDKLS